MARPGKPPDLGRQGGSGLTRSSPPGPSSPPHFHPQSTPTTRHSWPRRHARGLSAYCTRTGQSLPSDEGAIVRCCLESLALKYRLGDRPARGHAGHDDPDDPRGRRRGEERLALPVHRGRLRPPVHAGPIEATAIGNILMQGWAAAGWARSPSCARWSRGRSRSRSTSRRHRRLGRRRRPLRAAGARGRFPGGRGAPLLLGLSPMATRDSGSHPAAARAGPFGGRTMYWQRPPAFSPASCLVRVVEESDGRFTARVLGEPDLPGDVGHGRGGFVDSSPRPSPGRSELGPAPGHQLPHQNPYSDGPAMPGTTPSSRNIWKRSASSARRRIAARPDTWDRMNAPIPP